jgi:hypothetical protein
MPNLRTSAPAVPRSPEQVEVLLAERPPAWEYMLFAAVLWRGKEDLELRWRDHQLQLPTGDYQRVDASEVAGRLAAAFGRLAWTIRPMERVFAAQEDAFGAPGQSGDPELIRHFAGWIVFVYRRLMDWAGDVRCAGVPEELELAVELASQSADLPLARIRSFIDHVVAAVDELPARLAAAGSEPGPIEIDLTLQIEADTALMDGALDELMRAFGH